jgi:hypothetical protein
MDVFLQTRSVIASQRGLIAAKASFNDGEFSSTLLVQSLPAFCKLVVVQENMAISVNTALHREVGVAKGL